jgi:hypothetical protein
MGKKKISLTYRVRVQIRDIPYPLYISLLIILQYILYFITNYIIIYFITTIFSIANYIIIFFILKVV